MKNKDKKDIIMQIQEFNELLKKFDDIYHKLAKKSGLSDTAFWIIYTIKNDNKTYKQKDLCDIWSYSKQTINSALKKLEEQNIIKLMPATDNKKDKKIVLTQYGEEISKKYIEPMNEIEEKSLSNIDKNSREQLLKVFREYTEELSKETEIFIHKEET